MRSRSSSETWRARSARPPRAPRRAWRPPGGAPRRAPWTPAAARRPWRRRARRAGRGSRRSPGGRSRRSSSGALLLARCTGLPRGGPPALEELRLETEHLLLLVGLHVVVASRWSTPWVASRTSSSSMECPAARAWRTATAGQRTTSPSSAGPGSGSSGRAVSSSSMGKARTSVGPFSPIQRSCRLLMYSTSTHSTDSSAIGLTSISPSTKRQIPASSASSTAISDSLETSTGISAQLPCRRGRAGRAGAAVVVGRGWRAASKRS